MSKDNKAKLMDLSISEVKVLYWKYKGLITHEIADRIDRTDKIVHYHMSKIYQKLEIPKDLHWTKKSEIINHVYCPVLMDMVVGAEDLDFGWPETIDG